MSERAVLPDPFTERSVTINGRAVRYLESGQGRPVVVLHKAGGLTRSPAHDALAESYRVLMIEMPGFGNSTADQTSQTTRDYAGFVYRVATELTHGPFFLVGSSFGGRVAAWMAVDHEADIEALALLAPAVFTPPSFAVPRGASDARAIRLYAHPERHVRQAPDPAIVAKQLALVGRLLTPRDADLESRLASLSLPVLVAFGTDDEVMPSSLGRRYVEVNRGFFLSLFYDAGHALDEERPEALASLLSMFFDRPKDFHVCRADGRVST